MQQPPTPDPPKQPTSVPCRLKKNTYRFNMGNSTSSRQIFISSNFDSGNIQLIRQVSQTHYRLAAVPDFDGQLRSKKTWFYFKARAPKYVKVRLVIENVEILNPGYQAELSSAKPVYRVGEEGEWARLTDCYLSYREELEIQIEHTFLSEQSVYFALTVPFSYLQNNDYLSCLCKSLPAHIYFHKQILTYSANQLIVNLLTITERCPQTSSLQPTYEQLFNENLFPDNNRPLKINKPVVMIVCRVHPGEVSASHALVGMLRFLTSGDPRAYLLRRLFCWMVVPMVNPDGVYEGNYRMDSFSTNLNRVYNNPSQEMHSPVYAIKALVEHLNQEQRLSFFFDMHGHSAPRGAFIYGNAFDDIVNQVESQVFCKVLSMNSRYFQYEACNFQERHMKLKDRNEPLTKQGCARVVVGKLSGIIHCLTLQTGLHIVQQQKQNSIPQISNPTLQIATHKIHPRQPHTNPLLHMYYQIGESLLITILDVTQKNPYSRVPNSQLKSLQNIRKSLALSIFQQQQRFKLLDLKAYQKTKAIAKHIKETFIDKAERKWNFWWYEDLAMFDWPEGFQGFKGFKRERQLSMKRSYKKAVENVPLVMINNCSDDIKDINQLEAVLTQTVTEDRRKKLFIKSLSPAHRQATRSLPFEQVPKFIRMNVKLDHVDLLQKTNFTKNTSTRKLLREFEQVKQEIGNDVGSVKTEPSLNFEQVKTKAGAIQTISEEGNALFSEDNRQKLQTRLLNRSRNNGTLTKPRIKTEISNGILQHSVNPLIIKSNSRTCLKDNTYTLDHQEITIDPLSIQTRMKKIRNAKRQIINAKFNQIRKKSQKGNLFRLPQIRKLRYQLSNYNKEELIGQTVSVSILHIDTIKISTTKNKDSISKM